MEFKVGEIVEGKVKSITNFGAFISLPEGKTGMVHISEIAHAYVSDIRQHLTEGQAVKVMILAVDPNGKINLSIKRLEAKPQRENTGRPGNGYRGGAPRQEGGFQPRSGGNGYQNRNSGRAPVQPAAPKTADQLFEEKLKAFMSESDSKISSIKAYSEHRTKSRRR